MVGVGAFNHKLDCFGNLLEILNLEVHLKCITGSRVMAILMNGKDFAYWWSGIGKGLRLKPAQQACFFSML